MPDLSDELKTPDVAADDISVSYNVDQPKDQYSWSHSTDLWKSSKLPPPGGERVIGRNRVLLKGWCLVGPGQHMALFALALILIPCTITDAVTVPWYQLNTFAPVGILVTLFLIVLQLITLASFLTIAYSDPGIVPRAKNSLNTFDLYLDKYRQNNPPKYQEIIIRGHLFRLKYCSTCNIYRFPRTIHCYVCNNCVEQFDHHCPWFGNCIGRKNYRRFYLFLVITSVLILVVLGCAVAKLVYVIRQNTAEMKKDSSTVVGLVLTEAWDSVVLVLYTIAIVWFVIGLCIYHTYLIGTNQSTYEQIKGIYDNRDNPWNKAVLNNIRDVLCHKHRPSLLNKRALAMIQEIEEPRYLDSQNLGLNFFKEENEVNDNEKNETEIIPQYVAKSCPQTSYCGIDLCSLPEAP